MSDDREFRVRPGRIRSTLPGDAGAIAAALIVGDRAGISAETGEAMRVAGISHVLSISGVHMSLVAAFLFGVSRLFSNIMIGIPTIVAAVCLIKADSILQTFGMVI